MAYIFDGVRYENEEDMPDIGGFKCTEVTGDNVRGYYGLSSGIDTFTEAVDYAGDGSTAYCVDTGEMYLCFDGTWYKQ